MSNPKSLNTWTHVPECLKCDNQGNFQVSYAGPKISIFLTLPNSDSGCKAALPEVPAGNKEKFCAFTMAWKRFRYISEVSGLIQ